MPERFLLSIPALTMGENYNLWRTAILL